MRVVIAEDSLLVRAGIVSILRGAGIDVVAEATSAEELLQAVDEHPPTSRSSTSACPPTSATRASRRARAARTAPRDRHRDPLLARRPGHRDARARRAPGRLGYLLKDRVGDVDEFVGTLRRVAAGGSALDPEVVSRLLASHRNDGPLQALTPRELEVLQLVAEGRSNKGIGDRLAVSERAVQKHVTAIFGKFGLPAGEDDNRRILAVLEYVKR